MRRPRLARLLALALFGLVMAPPATAETTMCTAIISLPYTINAPGTYCLLSDLTTSMPTGTAISINASSVTLDLNGHKLAGSAGSSAEAAGIVATGKKFVVVRNGIVRGFHMGVIIDGQSSASVIEDIIAERNWFMGLKVQGQGIVVRRNLVVNTGGSTLQSNAAAIGIQVLGSGTAIADNDITGVTGSGSGLGVGIDVVSASTIVIERNRISNAGDFGVSVTSTSAVLISDNRFTSMPTALTFASSTGKYRDNLVAGVSAMSTGPGVLDVGGNNSSLASPGGRPWGPPISLANPAARRHVPRLRQLFGVADTQDTSSAAGDRHDRSRARRLELPRQIPAVYERVHHGRARLRERGATARGRSSRCRIASTRAAG